MPFGIKKKNKKKSESELKESKSSSKLKDSQSNANQSHLQPQSNQSNGQTYKYAPNLKKNQLDIGGLPVNVFGLDELSPALSRATAAPLPEVCLTIHCHGRTQSAAHDEELCRQLWDRVQRDKSQYGGSREHLIVSFDARNHGHRMTSEKGRTDWKQGNDKHA